MHMFFFIIMLFNILEKQPYIRVYDVNNGLSQNVVYSLMYDSYGYVWVGTQDGLNRFDGQEFKVYRQDFNDSTSLSSNAIHTLIQRKNGSYWIGTSNGINILPHAFSNTFDRMNRATEKELTHNYILSLFEDSDENVWIGTIDGLSFYSNKSKQMKTILPYGRTFFIFEDDAQTIWIVSQHGLLTYNPRTKRVRPVENVENNLLVGNVLDKRTILLGNKENQLFIYDLIDRKKTRVYTHPLFSSITSVAKINDSLVYVGTRDSGLLKFNPNEEQLNIQQERFYNFSENSRVIINRILVDPEQNVWFGTWSYGLLKYNTQSIQFDHYLKKNRSNYNVQRFPIIALTESSDGDVWYSVANHGLEVINPITYQDKTELYAKRYPKLFKEKNIHFLYKEEHTIWFGIGGKGLISLDDKTKRITEYPQESFGLVNRIIKGNTTNLWIATGTGLFSFDLTTKKFSRYTNTTKPQTVTNHITDVLVGDTLLVGTSLGLFWLEPNSEKLHPFPSINLSNPYILRMYKQENILWVGTANGLNKYNLETKETTFYSMSDGLPNNVIYAILEDEFKNLWMSTNNGIARLSYDSGAYHFDHFNEAHNIQSKEFNHSAFHKGNNGQFYFGGINGFNRINTRIEHTHPQDPKVYITRISLMNNQLDLYDATDFKHSEKNIQFEFSALSHAGVKEYRYAYKLEGFNTDWVYIGQKSSVNFTNLSGNAYTFRVRVQNEHGKLGKHEATYSFVIHTPFWYKSWFYISVFILFICSIYLFLKIRLYTIRKHNTELEDLVKKRTGLIYEKNSELSVANKHLENALQELRKSEDKNKTLLEFIIHDLKHPLNKILSLSRKAPTDETQELIHFAANETLNMSLNILETQMYENKALTLSIKPHNLRDIAHDSIHQMNTCALEKNLLIQNCISREFTVDVDRPIILRVFLNLVTNAIKYSECNTEIIIDAYENQKNFQVSVSDTGKTIPKDKLDDIFNKYTRLEEAVSSSIRSYGLGLPFSKIAVEAHKCNIWAESSKERTTFYFTLPKSDIVCISEKSELKENQFAFTENDLKLLAPIYQKIQTFQVYDASAIFSCLDDIKHINEPRIIQWCKEVENAVLFSNKIRFNELIHLLEVNHV